MNDKPSEDAMQPEPEKDELLMAKAAGGNRECLEILVRRYADSLLTFIVRMVGHYHRSEELFQEVFLAVWRKRKQYQYPRSFKAWLFAIAANKCRAHFRGKRAAIVAFVPNDEPPDESGKSPSSVLVADETATLVKTAVARLPKQQQLVVVLRVWNGLSYEEIAETLGRTEATIRSNMHHALAALRRYLEPRLK